MEKELEIKVLGEAIKEIEEFIEIFDEEDGDLHEARMCLELSLQNLTDKKYKGLQKRYYEADDLLDRAEAKFRRLYKDLGCSLERLKDKEVSSLISDEDLEQHASDLRNHLENACSDIAHSEVEMFNKGTFMGAEGTDIKLENAKKDGVIDLAGWYADELYNDVDTIGDLLGDRIHDAAKGNNAIMIAIATKIRDTSSHTALQEAMTAFITRHEKG